MLDHPKGQVHNDFCYSGCESAKSISPLWEMYVLLVPASLIPRPSGIMRVGTGPALVILDGLGTSLARGTQSVFVSS